MACDICLKTGDCERLNSMLDFSVTKDMVICGSCSRKASNILNSYRSAAWNRTRKKLKAMYKEARGGTEKEKTNFWDKIVSLKMWQWALICFFAPWVIGFINGFLDGILK